METEDAVNRNNIITLIDLMLYASILVSIELAKDFNLVGTATVKARDIWDWSIMGVSIWATIGITFKAYFDKSYMERKNGLGTGHTSFTKKGPEPGK